MIKILLGNSRIGGEFFGKSLGKKLGRDPFYPNVAGKGVHALKRKEQHTVGHLFAHTLDFAQLLLRLLKGKVGPHGKRNLAACHLFCRVCTAGRAKEACAYRAVRFRIAVFPNTGSVYSARLAWMHNKFKICTKIVLEIRYTFAVL